MVIAVIYVYVYVYEYYVYVYVCVCVCVCRRVAAKNLSWVRNRLYILNGMLSKMQHFASLLTTPKNCGKQGLKQREARDLKHLRETKGLAEGL